MLMWAVKMLLVMFMKVVKGLVVMFDSQRINGNV